MSSKDQRIEIFAQAIVEGKTQSDAYRLAYPVSKKWKDAAVHVKASTFAKDDKVLVRVTELREGQIEKHHATVQDILTELSYTAKFNPLDFYNKDGTQKPIHELPVEAAKAVSITGTEDGVTWHFRQSDKNKAAQMLGEFYQMWSENVVHPGGDAPLRHQHVHIHAEMTLEEATRIYREFMNDD